jgi:predicted metalloprotease with PDZ domain
MFWATLARNMAFTLRYELSIADARAHLLSVRAVLGSDAPFAAPSIFYMPVWTPGSYLVREYARHVEGVLAFADGAPCSPVKIRKNAWRAGHEGASEISLRYLVYSNELTVRTNHLDDTHALLTGAALFVAVEGHESLPAKVEILLPDGWNVMTALPRLTEGPSEKGRVRLLAKDYDTLVDSPLELGHFRAEQFEAKGVLHAGAFGPAERVDDAQVATLLRDFAKIVATESGWFGDKVPYDRYTALLHLSPRTRGGLEHLSSAALIASSGAFATRDSYLDLLSLLAHELFHAWNVKRIRPGGLSPYRYQEENYTRLLWWFEGATSYYDWRTLLVSGLCTSEEYLDHLASEIAALDRTPGRLVQSLEQASFDAWIKLYRPDENSENSSVSYYRKGEIVCALLDLEIRTRSGGRASLDKVLSHLWKHYGAVGRPVPEDAMQALMEEASGVSLGDLFDAWIRRPGELDYDRVLGQVGLRLEREASSAVRVGESALDVKKAPRAALGLRLRNESHRTVVAAVARGGAAQLAGIDPGDELISIGGRRIEAGAVDAALSPHAPGEEVEVSASRDGRIVSLKVRLEEARPEKVRIVRRPDASDEARALGVAWLASRNKPSIP